MILLHTGPKVTGKHMFDEHCIFGNNLELSERAANYLDRIVKDSPAETIKYYVYRMTKSTVIPKKAKMVRFYLLDRLAWIFSILFYYQFV